MWLNALEPGGSQAMHAHAWMGLWVEDSERYARYRAEMLPLLRAVEGYFGHDFDVCRVHRSESGDAINRVFSICFPTRETREALFADPDCQRARAAHFEPSVSRSARLACFDEPGE